MKHQQLIDEIPNGDQYLQFLQENLTPGRLVHSLDVTAVMDDLAEVYTLDREKALTAGLLHDAVKDFPDNRLSDLASAYNIPINHPCEAHPLYLHGPVCARFVKDQFAIDDPSIIDAIYTHTLVENNSDFHAPFSWCLRFADVLAESRSWKDVQAVLRPVVYAGKLEKATTMVMHFVLELYRQSNIPIHPRFADFIVELESHDLSD